jgi:RNA polymerase sigma-70 factor (ECF subfamily)
MSASEAESAVTQKLLTAVANGEDGAVDRLLARHRPEIVQFVRLRFDPRLRARIDPSDVVQETQMEVARRLDDYLRRRPMPFRIWLRRTAYQRLLMVRRRHLSASQRSAHCELPLPDRSSRALARSLLAPPSAPGHRLRQQELAAVVRHAVGKLNNRDREVLLMRTFEDASYEEIGFLFGISIEAAKKRHGRALLRLHKILLESGLSEGTP